MANASASPYVSAAIIESHIQKINVYVYKKCLTAEQNCPYPVIAREDTGEFHIVEVP